MDARSRGSGRARRRRHRLRRVVAPPHEARALGELFFNKNMARAEVVIVRGGIVHDYRIDQGKVVGVRGGSIELLEQDGTRQLIPVSPTAQVIVNGRCDARGDTAAHERHHDQMAIRLRRRSA